MYWWRTATPFVFPAGIFARCNRTIFYCRVIYCVPLIWLYHPRVCFITLQYTWGAAAWVFWTFYTSAGGFAIIPFGTSEIIFALALTVHNHTMPPRAPISHCFACARPPCCAIARTRTSTPYGFYRIAALRWRYCRRIWVVQIIPRLALATRIIYLSTKWFLVLCFAPRHCWCWICWYRNCCACRRRTIISRCCICTLLIADSFWFFGITRITRIARINRWTTKCYFYGGCAPCDAWWWHNTDLWRTRIFGLACAIKTNLSTRVMRHIWLRIY